MRMEMRMEMQMTNIKVGDRIQFRSITRWNSRTVWRKVNGFWAGRGPTVRFGGWGNFIVRWDEIVDVDPA